MEQDTNGAAYIRYTITPDKALEDNSQNTSPPKTAVNTVSTTTHCHYSPPESTPQNKTPRLQHLN